jgi:hypothetical protein
MWSVSTYYLSTALQEKVKKERKEERKKKRKKEIKKEGKKEKTESFNLDIQCPRCVTYSSIRIYCK